ncbi:nuclear transport factor 2 family protein [Sphingopyxis flava]|uniref:SnoaL-like domain-containing protein n=1 Tax=Sphingopyxis flava TaxID=1507287 RepID=A0A1T5FLV3_9SPHN|nr:nuclear transport factor 2 family protein [Sphingopyxis flava]SKB97153.1 SnoaL-like domain-containing protein [Sphingopyxis flava]
MDFDLIRREGELSKAAAARVWRHADTEKLSDIKAIMATLSGGDGEITYAMPMPGPNGEMTIPPGTTLADAEEHYRLNYSVRNHIRWEAFVELRKPWYVFFEGVEHYNDLLTGEKVEGHSITFFQTAPDKGDGIQGEMGWSRYPELPGYTARVGEDASTVCDASVPRSKAANLALFRRLMEGLRQGDPDAVLATMCDDPQCAIRNQVDGDDACLLGLAGAPALRAHLVRFAETFDVLELDIANIVTGDWYVFAELRWVVRERSREGQVRIFHTAEFLPVSNQSVFSGRVGFGTPFL